MVRVSFHAILYRHEKAENQGCLTLMPKEVETSNKLHYLPRQECYHID